MEIAVLSDDGVPENSLLQLQVNGKCRQGLVSARKAFRFAVPSDDVGTFKVDILAPIGTAHVVARPGATEYAVPIARTDGGADMKLRLSLAAASEGINETTQIIEEATDAKTVKRHSAALQARDYLDEHKLAGFIQSMLEGLLKSKPADPYQWMMQQLENSASLNRAGVQAVPDVPPLLTPSRADDECAGIFSDVPPPVPSVENSEVDGDQAQDGERAIGDLQIALKNVLLGAVESGRFDDSLHDIRRTASH